MGSIVSGKQIMKRIGEDGLKLLQGFEDCELAAYQDVAGIWTIGFGHTGPEVREGLTCSPERANELLKQDLATAENAIHKHVTYDIEQCQFDALVCLVYNIGAGAFQASTLLRLLNKGESAGAGDQFLRWNHAGGKVVGGLTRRRKAERDLFLSGSSSVADR